MSSSPAAAPTRARSVNGPLPQLLVGPGRLASPHVADPSPAAPRWLRLVPLRVVFLVVLALALAVLLGAGLVRAVVRALTALLGQLAAGLPPLPSGVVAGLSNFDHYWWSFQGHAAVGASTRSMRSSMKEVVAGLPSNVTRTSTPPVSIASEGSMCFASRCAWRMFRIARVPVS